MLIYNPKEAVDVAYPTPSGDFVIKKGETKEVEEELGKAILYSFDFLEIAGESSTDQFNWVAKHKELFGKLPNAIAKPETIETKVRQEMIMRGMEIPKGSKSKFQLRREAEQLSAQRPLSQLTMEEVNKGVAFLDGEPYCIIDDGYVPYDEAQIIIQERKVAFEQDKLSKMKEELSKKKEMI